MIRKRKVFWKILKRLFCSATFEAACSVFPKMKILHQYFGDSFDKCVFPQFFREDSLASLLKVIFIGYLYVFSDQI